MPRTAFDIDNVLCDTLTAARRAKEVATGLQSHHILDTFDYGSPFTHQDPAVAELLLTPHSFWTDADMIASCLPMPGAVETMRKAWRMGFLAAYVTRRSDSLAKVTAEWLDRHGFPEAPLHFVGHDDEHLNHEMTKSQACIAVGATHLVDDSQAEAADALLSGLSPILVDHPLGRKARRRWLNANEGVRLAADVAEAVEMLAKAA